MNKKTIFLAGVVLLACSAAQADPAATSVCETVARLTPAEIQQIGQSIGTGDGRFKGIQEAALDRWRVCIAAAIATAAAKATAAAVAAGLAVGKYTSNIPVEHEKMTTSAPKKKTDQCAPDGGAGSVISPALHP